MNPGTYKDRTATTHMENEIKMLLNSNQGCSSREGVREPSTAFSP